MPDQDPEPLPNKTERTERTEQTFDEKEAGKQPEEQKTEMLEPGVEG